jgi:hypothetical protein
LVFCTKKNLATLVPCGKLMDSWAAEPGLTVTCLE